MADGETKGKTFSFNLTGDEFHLFETVKAAFEGERESEDEKFREKLAGLDAETRRLIEARLAPAANKVKELSQREVFGRALRHALDVLEAKADAEESADAPEAPEENLDPQEPQDVGAEA